MDVSLCDLGRDQVEFGAHGVCECARVAKVIGLCVLQRLGLIGIQRRRERRLRWELKNGSSQILRAIRRGRWARTKLQQKRAPRARRVTVGRSLPAATGNDHQDYRNNAE